MPSNGKKKSTTLSEQVTISLDQLQINKMMQFYVVDNDPTSSATNTAVNRALNFYTRQSLERDGYKPENFSVQVSTSKKNGTPTCNITIKGSDKSILQYKDIVTKFWDLSAVAYATYDKLNKEAQAKGMDTSAITFSSDLGLPFTTLKSISLLYFPPNSTKIYSDYQYAQTLSAYWANMAHNGCRNEDMISMARIVDITALVSSATAASDDVFNFLVTDPNAADKNSVRPDWDAYIEQQLVFYLGLKPPAKGDVYTLPVVVMGTKPQDWLKSHHKEEIKQQLGRDYVKQNDVVILSGLAGKDSPLKTPVMFSIHPSAVLFDVNKPFDKCLTKDGHFPTPFEVVMQGQIAAGWNVIMGNNPQTDPLQAKKAAEDLWRVSEEEMKNGIIDPDADPNMTDNKKRVFSALLSKYTEFGLLDQAENYVALQKKYVTDYKPAKGDLLKPTVDNWVYNPLEEVNIEATGAQVNDPRFNANKVLVAVGEPAAYAQFVVPTDFPEASKIADHDQRIKAPWSMQVVSPRPLSKKGTAALKQITTAWKKDKLALHYWDQKQQGSVLSGGWVLPPSEKKKELDHAKNNVRVSGGRSKFVYADVTKHLLAGGEPFVEISGLGAAISDAVAVAEMLKNQGLVTVDKINTSRGVEGAKRQNTDRIVIKVVKSKGFDAIYKEQQEQREAAKKEAEEK